MVFRIKMFFLSFNVKNGDLDIRWQLRHKKLKELEMDHLVFSRRKVLGQMAVSAAGILGLSATNKAFADESGGVSVSSGNSEYPYIHARVTYRNPGRSPFAVGALVTIKCAARCLSFSKATDIRGGAMFNLHQYYGHHRPSNPWPTDTWIMTVTFRGQTQRREYRVRGVWSYINSVWNF